jgi:integrase
MTSPMEFLLLRSHRGQKFLGYYPEMKIEQARVKASELNTVFGNGRNPFDEAAAAKQEPTLRDLFDAYLDQHMKKRKTADETTRCFERWFSILAKRKASAISHHDAEKLHGDIAASRGEYAANRAVQLGRAVYNFAKKTKLYLGENPLTGITLFDEEPRDRFLSDEEAIKVMSALATETNADLRDFVLLDLCTGVRKANVLEMEWTNVNFDLARWTIPDTKNGTKQLIPLSVLELAVLQHRKNQQEADRSKSPFVFPGTGASGHLMDLKRSWTTFRKRIGIEDVTIHDLRRSLASAMASRNVNVALIKSALHHKDMKTTLNAYAHAGKTAELEARELAVNPWLEAAGIITSNGENILPFQMNAKKLSTGKKQ